MITVLVAPDLIEQMFRTGNEMRRTRVIQGLPDGAKLVSATVENRYGNIVCVLQFADPEFPKDREIDIKLQSFYDVPQMEQS